MERAVDRTKAEEAIRHGSNAGLVSAAVTLLLAIVTAAADVPALTDMGIDPWFAVDAVVIAGLALWVRRGSVAASVVLVLYFLAGKVILASSTGQLSGAGVSLVFLFFFARAAWGAITLRRLDREEAVAELGPEPAEAPSGNEWGKLVGAGLVVCAMSLVGLGFMIEFGMIPDTVVMSGDRVPQRVVDFLREEGLIGEEERIILFYSAALFSYEREGNVLTDRGALSYEVIEGELWSDRLSYDEIADVFVEGKGSALEDALVAVYDEEGDGFYLNVSVEEDGLQTFLDTLNARRGVEPPPLPDAKAAKVEAVRGGS